MLTAARSTARVRTAVAWLVAGVVAADPVVAGHGFNPTIERQQLYPDAPAIEFLRAEPTLGRLAPVGRSDQLVEGHVWGVYGLSAVTGFDFFGDRTYQQFMATASGLPVRGARSAYVSIPPDAQPNLPMLGLLRVTHLVAPPVEATGGPGTRPSAT